MRPPVGARRRRAVSPRPDDARSREVRGSIAMLAALVLGGGGGAAAGARYLGDSPAPIYQKLDEHDVRLRERETAAARTDAKLDALLQAVERVDRKLDEAPTRRR